MNGPTPRRHVDYARGGVGEEQRQFLQQTRNLARTNNSTLPQRNRKSQPIDMVVEQGETFGTYNFPKTHHQ